MAGAKNHDYHILPPDIWPLVGSISAVVLTSGGVLSMHPETFGGAGKYVLALGAFGVLLTFYSWWSNVNFPCGL